MLSDMLDCTLSLLLLLFVVGGQSQCPTNFPTLDTVRNEAIFIGDITSRDIEQNLIPDIKFTCSGTLTKWTIVASQVGGGSRYPQLQIWRNTAGTEYNRIASSDVRDSTSVAHVYEVIPDPPLEFQTGDILGVYTPPVPKLSFKYQQSGGPKNYYIGGPANPYDTFNLNGGLVLTAHNDYPLVSVEVSPPQCATGFIDDNTLLIKASILSSNRSDLHYREATQRIVPNMMFSCNGVILRLTLAALDRGEATTYPDIQLWRRVDETQWIRVGSIGRESAISTTEYLNVHEYNPVPAVQFQSGDILGIYQPYTSASVFKIYLHGNTGPENYYIGSLAQPKDDFSTDGGLVGTEQRTPLVAVDISVIETSTMSPITRSHTHPSQTSSTIYTPNSSLFPIKGQSSTDVSEIAGLAVALVICVCLTILSLVVITVLVLRRRRNMRHNHQQVRVTINRDTEGSMEYNPMYRPRDPSDVIISGQRCTLPLETNKAYEEPGSQPRTGAGDFDHIYESID